MRRKDEASAFIIALGILVILFIMAITFATMMVMESRAARNYNDAALCEDVAYGALEEAINALFRDKYGEDASVVAGSLVLQPYNDDAVDENYDFWGTGAIPEDSGSWPGQGQGTEGNEPFSDSASNTVDLNGDGTDDSQWIIYGPLPGGLLGRYAILITDDREARVNVNTAGNLADDSGADLIHSSNMGASVTEVSLENLFQLFEDINGTDITQGRAQALARAIILARCIPPGGGTTEPGSDTDDDGDIGDDGVDNNGDGEIDETDENENEDDEFNPLFAVEDTPFALPHEVADVFPPADAGTVSSSDASSLTDITKSWTADEWIDAVVAVDTDNDGTYDEIRAVTGNTSDALTADANWGITPDVDDNYSIYFTVMEVPDTCLPTQPAGTAGLTLADSLTTYSVGTVEHPYSDTSVNYPRYKFGLNQFDIDTLNPTQVDDLKDILETVGGFSTTDPAKPDPYQFIVNFKDALDGDSTVTDYTVGATTYYGVELHPLVFITEVMRVDDPVLPARAYHFIEFYNPSPDPITVFNWNLNITGGPGGSISIANDTIPGNGFYLMGGDGRYGGRVYVQLYQPLPGSDITALELTCGSNPPSTLPNDTIIDKADGFAAFTSAGTVTFAIGDTLTDNTKSWIDDEWAGATVYVDTGNNGDYDEVRTVSTNTSDTLTVSVSWVTTPSAGEPYYVESGSQERHDFKVNQWTKNATGHTFESPPFTADAANPRGFDEEFALFIAPDYLDLNGSGSTYDEITGAEVVNYDINLANLGDLSRFLLMGYTNATTGDSISQMFALDAADGSPDCWYADFSAPADTGTVDSATANTFTDTAKSWTDDEWIGAIVGVDTVPGGDLDEIRSIIDNDADTLTVDSPWGTPPAFGDSYSITQTFHEIKFDISYANHREVLGYLTVLNPMGDGYDDDGDGVADDIGPDDTGFTDPSEDLGGPEHRIPGMININTASREVLMALPGMDAFENDGVDNDGDTSTDEVGEGADTIIANRPYAELGELFNLSGMDWLGNNLADDNGNGIVDETEEEFLIFGAISNIITTRSNVFTVYCLAQVGVWNDLNGDDEVDPGEFTPFAERELMAIVDRSTQPINVRFQRWLTD